MSKILSEQSQLHLAPNLMGQLYKVWGWASPDRRIVRVTRRILLLVPPFLLCAILLILLMRPVYAVRVTVAPPLEDGAGRSGAGLSSLGSLGAAASLLGGGLTPPTFLRFEDVYGSVRVAQRLIDKYHLERRVFYKNWNPAAHQWERPGGIFGAVRDALAGMTGAAPWSPPDATIFARYLKDQISIEKDSTYGTEILTYQNKDSVLATDVLMLTVRESENILIESARERYGKQVSYLESELQRVTGSELRGSLITLLTDAERNRMVVASSGTYAAEIIDGPVVPAKPSKPRGVLVLIASFVLAILIVAALELYKVFQTSRRRLLDLRDVQ